MPSRFDYFKNKLLQGASLSVLPALVHWIFFYIPSALFIMEDEGYESISDVIRITIELFFLFLNIYYLYILSYFTGKLFHIIVAASYLLGGLSIYFLINYKKILSYDLIENWHYHSKGSFFDIIMTGQSMILALTFLVISIFILGKAKDIYKSDEELFFSKYFKNPSSIHLVSAMAAILAVFWSIPVRERIANNYVPYNIIKYGINFIAEIGNDGYRQKRDISKEYDYSFDQDEKGLNIILVIGEALMSNFMEINGQTKIENNPLLKNVDNLISFNNNYLPNNRKSLAFHSIMLRRIFFGREDGKSLETSIISVMKGLGFKTTIINPHSGLVQNKFSDIFSEADKIYHAQDIKEKFGYKETDRLYDSDTVKFYNLSIDKKENNFVIINSLGNSWPYHEKYKEEFDVFKPSCVAQAPSNCSYDEISNAYNNSILSTDNFLFDLISANEKDNTLLFFVSDQTQDSVVKNIRRQNRNYKLKKNSPKKEKDSMIRYDGEMFVWFSDKFADNYRDNVLYLIARKHKISSVGDIFHSILGCVDIQSEIIDPAFNLCSVQNHHPDDFDYKKKSNDK